MRATHTMTPTYQAGDAEKERKEGREKRRESGRSEETG